MSQSVRLFSGIQPTGCMHLGNYFGVIRNWIAYQNDSNKNNELFFSIVDLHALTVPKSKDNMQRNILLMTASLLASGINPNKCHLFLQSMVPEHTYLSWILSCITTMPRLSQLPQYKEKSALLKEIPLGLFIYPVLQSADILLYKATKIPVGKDQIQHIQFAQHLAQRFNFIFKCNLFPRPEAVLTESSHVRSLRNPNKKMSKSDPDIKSCIEFLDSFDNIKEKCKKALTDFDSKITFDLDLRPAVSNLVLLHNLCTGTEIVEICQQNAHLDTGQYKLLLAEVINDFISPIRAKMEKMLGDPEYLLDILKKGSIKAREEAQKTLEEVKKIIGLN